MLVLDLLLADARADQAMALEACLPAAVRDSHPADGDTGVAPDVVAVVVFDAPDGVCGYPAVALAVDGVPAEALVVDTPDAWTLTVAPVEPFAPGAEVVIALDTGEEIAFTVGEAGAAPAAPPAEVALEVGECRSDGVAPAVLTVTFDAEDPAARGVLRPELSIGASGFVRQGAGVVHRGEAVVDLRFTVPGNGDETCVRAVLDDETGAEAWATDVVCAEVDRCRVRGQGPFGCATAPAGAGLVLPALLAMTWPRRRRPACAPSGSVGS